MAAGDTYRVLAVFHDDDSGKDLSTGFHIQQNALVAPDITAVGDIVKEWWDTGAGGADPYKQYVTADMDLTRVTLRRVDPLEPVEFIYTAGLPISGTSADEPSPPVTAIVASLRTAKIGRSFRGRMYLPRPSEGFLDTAGAISAAVATDIATGITAVHANFNAMVPGSSGAVVFSRVLNESNDIITVLVDRIVRTQRRRANKIPSYEGV